MKALILSLIIFCSGFSASAQKEFSISDNLYYAVIKDTDGYVNIRKEPGVNALIVGKINNYSIFSCEPNDKTNWWKVMQVDNQDKSNILEGYIYKNRVSLLKNWDVIKKSNSYVDSGIFKKDSINIIIKTSAFRPKNHKLLYKEKELVKIDGKLFWGTDGEVPKEKISSGRIIKTDKIIPLPKSALENLYQPNLSSISICKGPDNTFYISMLNSDGAGGYYIIWVLKNNKYLNRYIDDSEE